MRRVLQSRWFPALGLLLYAATVVFAEREFRVYASLEPQADVALPEGWDKPAGFVVARMMYPGNFGFRRALSQIRHLESIGHVSASTQRRNALPTRAGPGK